MKPNPHPAKHIWQLGGTRPIDGECYHPKSERSFYTHRAKPREGSLELDRADDRQVAEEFLRFRSL